MVEKELKNKKKQTSNLKSVIAVIVGTVIYYILLLSPILDNIPISIDSSVSFYFFIIVSVASSISVEKYYSNKWVRSIIIGAITLVLITLSLFFIAFTWGFPLR